MHLNSVYWWHMVKEAVGTKNSWQPYGINCHFLSNCLLWWVEKSKKGISFSSPIWPKHSVSSSWFETLTFFFLDTLLRLGISKWMEQQVTDRNVKLFSYSIYKTQRFKIFFLFFCCSLHQGSLHWGSLQYRMIWHCYLGCMPLLMQPLTTNLEPTCVELGDCHLMLLWEQLGPSLRWKQMWVLQLSYPHF